MGKRRLKYYRVSTHENEHFSEANRTRSFGRCQLIQSYILEKTGKNRSRKQVSSHLQRLKKIHKDNPASWSCVLIAANRLLIFLVRPLFSERSQPPSEHCSAPQTIATISSQDGVTNASVSTRHLKSDLGLAVNLQNADTGADSSSTFSHASEASSFNGDLCNGLNLSSTNFHDQPSFSSPQEFLSLVPQQCPASTLHPSDSDYLSELQDVLLFEDAINERFRAGSAFNTSAFSISMRRLASKLPIQGRLMDPGSTTSFSHALSSPGFQPTHQWISHGSLMDGVSCDSPFTSAQEVFHTPFLPLQFIPPEKHRLHPGLTSEWMWPQNPDIPFYPRDGTFGELHLRYPAMYQYPTYPEMWVNTPTSHSSPSESELSRLSRGLSYSYAITSPATASESISNGGAIDFPRQTPESSEGHASPLVIRPTPVYPISYIHPDGHPRAPSLPP